MRNCLAGIAPGPGRRLGVLGVLGAVAAHFALAGSSACINTSQEDPPNDVISFCEAVAQARCQMAAACSVDTTTCQQYQNAQCSLQAQIVTTAATRTYDPTAGAACIQALQSAFGAGIAHVGFDELKMVNDTCQRAYAGDMQQGAGCHSDYDCAAGLSCTAKTPGGDPVVCEPAQPVAQGQSCSGLGAMCAAGTYCSDQSGQWQCTAGAAVGQPCAAGIYCLGAQHCMAHICPMPGNAGASCVSDGDCGADAPYCDPNSATCAPGLAFQPGSVDCSGLTGVMNQQSGPDASAGDGPDPAVDGAPAP
jgi:hypothetical protein